MPFNIQNLSARASQVGRTVEDFANDISGSAQGFRQSANIAVNGVASAIEGSVSDIASAANFINNPGGVIGGIINDGIAGVLGGLLGGGSGIAGGIQKNPLSSYASYNCIFTLGVLSKFELHNPELTYRRTGKPSIVILRSGGTGSTGQVKTTLEKVAGITGEYFIDDVEIDTLIAPNPSSKQTNATNISFSVTEPYSMGLFLQSLQLAALQGGHQNYLQAPYLLSVEFIGWDDNGRPKNISNTRRMFPLKFSNVEFEVAENGSQYAVSAIPYNEAALADEIQSTAVETNIKGTTVAELLQTGPESLATILNTRELEEVNAGNKKVGDQYIFMFPKEFGDSAIGEGQTEDNSGATTQSSGGAGSSGTTDVTEEEKQELYYQLTGISEGDVPADFDAEISKLLGIVVQRSQIGESIRENAEKDENINSIGQAKIVKNFTDAGTQIFGKPGFVKDPETGKFNRGNITISDEGRQLEFRQGTKLQDIVEEIIILSEYGRNFVTEAADSAGFKTWFRIETQVYIDPDSSNVAATGDNAKIYVYRIVPYKVHSSRLASPTVSPPGYPMLRTQASKEYNYIYTGKNDDILNFGIQINSAFFTAIAGDYGQLGASNKLQGSQSSVAPEESPVHGAAEGNNSAASSSGTGGQRSVPNTNTGGLTSNVKVHSESQIARSFNDAIVNSPVDLISVDLEIWGDPYYIADSGMGNYNGLGLFNMLTNGSMNYQSGEVDILINFRTPVDTRDEGYMKFPSGGTRAVGSFSGLYQVTTVKNSFSSNKFTQTLKTIRRRNQPSDTGVTPIDIGIEAIIEKGLDAIMSPIASAPAAAFAGALSELGGAFNELNAALSNAGGALANGAAQLESQVNSLAGNLAASVSNSIPANLTAGDTLSNVASQAASAASQTAGQLGEQAIAAEQAFRQTLRG
jgi:hypothetical protein